MHATGDLRTSFSSVIGARVRWGGLRSEWGVRKWRQLIINNAFKPVSPSHAVVNYKKLNTCLANEIWG